MKKKTTTTRSRLLLHALAQLRGNWKKQKCVVENSSSKQALKIRENWSIEISLSRYTDMNKRLLFILALSVATTWSQAQAQDEEDPCTLPASPGNCRGRKRRVFFNPDTKRCEIFFYTGCGGNANIFRNLIDCHETCKHHLENPPAEGEQILTPHVKSPHCLLPPEEEGPFRCAGAFPKYTFNANTGKCNRFIYGGCRGTANLYSTGQECISACVHVSNVDQPTPVRGRASFRSTKTKSPKGSSKKDKDRIVFPGFANDTDICQLPPIEPGLVACMAYMPKWTYDAKLGECVEYVYGGCRGTANLFNSQEECQARCPQAQDIQVYSSGSQRPALCSLPPIQSPGRVAIQCLAHSQKWTFNADKGQCEEYIYGGCFGTDNLFDSETECAKVCDPERVPQPKTINACAMPIAVGNCRGAKRRFGFNPETRRCEMFLYSGCGGNDNRFSSVSDCVNTCGGFQAAEDPLCTLASCNKDEERFYKAKACQPVYKAGDCCPSSWDCSLWEERLSRKDECFIANDDYPSGKYYAIGQDMKEIKGSCAVGCFCQRMADDDYPAPICSAIDCPSVFNPPLLSPAAQDCRQLYENKFDCCEADTKCDDELSDLARCSFENRTYVAGEMMYSEEDKCRVCRCDEGWTGEATGDFCYTVDSYSRRSDFLLRNCQPIFQDGVCGPVDWICPDEPQLIGMSAPAKMAVACPEGSDVIEEIADQTIAPLIEPLDSAEVSQTSQNGPIDPSDVCLLPKAIAPCTGFVDRWFFNINSRQCEEFSYGGFDTENGKNVFESQERCQEVCGKYAPTTRAENRCEAASEDDEAVPAKADRCRPRNAFRFNKETGKCENFVHLGCRLNANSFRTLDECEAVCGNPAEPEPAVIQSTSNNENCNLPAQSGNCRSRLKRFYFDTSSGQCRGFWYSGCQGNANNFEDERTCINQCVPREKMPRALEGQTLDVRSPCDQEKESGPCRGMKPKWYYDKASSTCQLFFYGGCQGNANQFDSLHECSQTCQVDWEAQRKIRQRCTQPKEEGTCRASKARFFFNRETNRCEFFLYSGCGGNDNNFASKSDCMLTCQFSLKNGGVVVAGNARTLPAEAPPRRGLALAPPRPWLVKEEDEPPIGTRIIQVGNAVTLPLELHGEERVANPDPCLMDKEIGPCRAMFQRYYYDRNERACKEFGYGGCQGNENNFASMDECEATCSNHIDDDVQPRMGLVSPAWALPAFRAGECSLPMDAGRCKAMRPKWFYNATSGACERFFWGGCEGNENRFNTKSECQSSCVVRSLKLRSPLDKDEALPPEPPKCEHNGRRFNLGDVIQFGTDKCSSCSCNAPPSLTCVRKKCPPEPTLPNSGNERCQFTYDDDCCCATGFQCVSANPPHIDG